MSRQPAEPGGQPRGAQLGLATVVSVSRTRFEAVAQESDLSAAFRRLATLGYDGVELAVRDPGLVETVALRRQLGAAGLEPVAIGTGQAFVEEGLSLAAPDPSIRRRALERLKAHVDLAAEVGAPQVIVGLIRGKAEAPQTVGDALALATEGLGAAAEHARPASVQILIEPINRYETNLVNRLEEGVALIEALGSPRHVRLLADTFHMNIEEPSVEASLVTCGEWIGHVHLADSNRLAPGWGHIDFPNILRVLLARGYNGYLSAEILPKPDTQSSARQAAAYLRALLESMGAGQRGATKKEASGP